MSNTYWLILAAGLALIANALAIWALRRRRGGKKPPKRLSADSIPDSRQGSLIFALTLLLASVPSILVVQDRWFGDWRVATVYGSPWCDLGLFCNTLGPMPLYIVPATACLAITFYLVGKQAQTGSPFHAFMNAAPNRGPSSSPLGYRQMQISDMLLIAAGAGLWIAILAGPLFQRVPQFGYALLLFALAAGLFLRTFSVGRLRASWSKDRSRISALLLLHIALVVLLAGTYGRQNLLWLYAAVLVAASLNALRYVRRIPPVFWLISAALLLNTYELNAWWFSIIGDEFEFYRFAHRILDEHGLASIGARFFDGLGIYGVQPYLSSVIQAASIGLFGPTNFGWRFSNLYLIALSTGMFYAFLESFTRRPIAFLGAGFLAVSHYLMTFGKIGYNNPQALFALTTALWTASQALRNPNVFWFAMIGISLGACFYVFPMAAFSIPAVLLLLWLYRRRRDLSPTHWLGMGLAASLTVYPLLLQPGYWESKQFGLFFMNPELMRSPLAAFSHLASNAFYSLIAFWIIPEETHFVTVAYADPISAVFILLGLAWLVRHGRNHPFGAFSLASYGLILILVGVVHANPLPSNTRMFLVLPWYGLLAALGLLWTANRARALGWPRWLRAGGSGAILLAILAANLYQAYGLSRERATRHQTFQMLIFGLAESTLRSRTGPQSRLVVLASTAVRPQDSLIEMLDLYQVPYADGQIRSVIFEGPEITAEDQAAVEAPGSLVILHPGVAESQQAFLATWMLAVGKAHCDVRNLRGEFLFRVWHAPDRPEPCEAL